MKHIVYSSIILLLLSCSKENENFITVKISSDNCDGCSLDFIQYDIVSFSQQKLQSIILDSTGQASATFPLTANTLATLKYGEQSVPIYLSPEENFEFYFNSENFLSSILYKGSGGNANSYLFDLSNIQNKLENFEGKYIFSLDEDMFFRRLNLIRDTFQKLHQTYFRNENSEKTLFEDLYKVKILSYVYNYILIHYNLYEKNIAISERFQSKYPLPQYDNLIDVSSTSFSGLLQLHLDKDIYPNLWPRNHNPDSIVSFPKNVDSYIRENNYSHKVRELLLAKNIIQNLNKKEKSTVVNDIYLEFTNEYIESAYCKTLQNQYNKWTSLKKGKASPNIVGLTLDGTEVNSSDFIGKVVYVDIWATWCKPCIEEFSVLNEIQNQYNTNENIVFLYVSVDKDPQKWREFIDKNHQDRDVDIIEKVTGSVYDMFLISGIPRYILIDKEGKIVDALAPKPSSGKIENLINALL